MNIHQDDRRRELDTRRSDVLADETRRRIIRILREHSGTLSVGALAEQLSDAASGSGPEGTARDTAESLRIHLHHVHLPKLAESGFVDWDEDAHVVTATDVPMTDASPPEVAVPIEGWDSIAPVLADDRRRETLALVESGDGPVSREELARELASREADGRPTETLVENLQVRLHHHYLPMLEQADLVEYDHDDATVAYRGPAELTAVLPGHVSDD